MNAPRRGNAFWIVVGTTLALAATRGAARASLPAALPAASPEGLVSVIVELEDPPVARYGGGVAGLAATSAHSRGAKTIDARSAAVRGYRAYLASRHAAFESAAKSAIAGARVTYRYDMVLGGMALLVPEKDLARLSSLPGVRAVHRDEPRRLSTDKSPAFVDAPALWSKLGGPDDAGEGVIVGVIDSGVWPEHPSLSDPDPKGKPYTAPPGTFGCDFSSGSHPGPAFACNGKLVGAYRFMASWDGCPTCLPTESFTSARDDLGHGTHVATTAAGNRGVKAEIIGLSRGTISGIAPRAHVIAYKACSSTSLCNSSDSVAAIQQAILDGVDVINFSVGDSGFLPYFDPVELAFLDAYAAGIFVAASAGNSGPAASTTDHLAGWVTTVAASTEKRQFVGKVLLSSEVGAKLTVEGGSIAAGLKKAAPVVDAAGVGDGFCQDGTEDGAFAGKVVLCQRGVVARVAKGVNVARRGAVGMIVWSGPGDLGPAPADPHVLPAVHLERSASVALLDFVAAHDGVTVKLRKGAAKSGTGDVLAHFSSRGGVAFDTGIVKPDLAAPGVQILAATSPEPATSAGGELFEVQQGTSMASPHVAGGAALLRQLHPSWTPGRIKSALMTSATREDLVKEDGLTPAGPFDAGSGRVDLAAARNPGLTFDASAQDYVDHEHDLWNVNYPSLYLSRQSQPVVNVERVARSELAVDSTWTVSVTAPADLGVIVPAQITVPAGGTASLPIGLDVRALPNVATRHAAIDLAYKGYRVHLPIVARGPLPPPNLHVDQIFVSSPATSGGSVSVLLVSANFTATPVPGAFDAKVYLSLDDVLSADDSLLRACSHSPIGAFQVANCASILPFAPVPSVSPGSYFVIGVTDTGDTVFETDETDNVLVWSTKLVVE